ncbi:hypothetical protein EAY39_15225 [Vibrio anguillarum]|uniref:hypothetical protein n=4 Tax=Vibrio anguillarum TaxID=55601 RepID=UPI00188CE2C1|nr:hypothetical protein [Vibrio anguillarum]MBF4250637.1 hypothetical protein [Vibrio anguillarum]MBF4342115.1 hypothetical protein [Vibrio anguillarum]
MIDELIRIISYLTFGIYVFAIASGILICLSVIFNFGKLADRNQSAQAEHSIEHSITRFIFGLMLIGVNFIAMYTLATLGADDQYIVDPYSALGYMNRTAPSSEELKLTLFVLTISRCIGGWGLVAGLKHGQHCAHPQEQVRQSARLRVGWGLFCGAVFIFPEFWMMIAENYYPNAAYFSNLFKSL